MASQITTNHEEIKRWVKERGGRPAVVKDTEGQGAGAGVIRINFPEHSEKDTLKEISWEDFFKTFDQRKLGFLYQDKTKDGQMSRFFKFIRQG
jgi:glutathione synthase/RimK-type ligase-like ATP-grasp enzyme